MITDQFSERHDILPSQEVKLRYAICSTPRSGSHYLGHLLKEGGKLGHPLEYFHAEHIKAWELRRQSTGRASMLEFLESIRTSPNGTFGIKVHFTQLPILEQHINTQDFVTSYKLIHIQRRNTLAQAVFLARASQTGAWISGMPEKSEPNYDRALILESLKRLLRDNASWECLFSAYHVMVHRVYLEDLHANTAETLRDVVRFLGCDADDIALPDESRLPRQQSDEINRLWAERFIQETHDLAVTSSDTAVCQGPAKIKTPETVPPMSALSKLRRLLAPRE